MTVTTDVVGMRGAAERRSWTADDSMLYALSVGAGAQDPGTELAFTTENTAGVRQRALPTMGAVLAQFLGGDPYAMLSEANWAMAVHGEQGLTLHTELPVAGTIEAVTEIVGMTDKGRNALVSTETRCVDVATGAPLFDIRSTAVLRGEGGFGASAGTEPRAVPPTPDRAPDAEIAYETRLDQPLLYRLNRDRNPLHSDPAAAVAAGFPRPIMHGLCTYGFAGRALLHALCDGDPARFQSMDVRFTSPVMPGETLVTRIWRLGGDEAQFQTMAGDRAVLDGGICRFSA